MLNVGGERHEVLRRTLRRMPRTRLGRLIDLLGDSDVDPSSEQPDIGRVLELCDDVRRETAGVLQRSRRGGARNKLRCRLRHGATQQLPALWILLFTSVIAVASLLHLHLKPNTVVEYF